MKKRILSMLLLVALLVTGIPVMAVSASDTEEPIEYVTDITTLYVGADRSQTTNGATLVGLYTAFKDEANAYDLTAGKWHNKMDTTGATDAILRDTTDDAAWAATANGGLTAGISTKEIYVAVGYSIGIDLPVAWAAEANAVVETTAIAVGLTGVTGTSIYPGDADETFRFDLLRGFFEPSTDAAATEGFTLNVVFRAQNSNWWDTNARNMNFRQACGVPGRASNSDKSKFAPTGLTMYMQKTTADNAVNYTVSYNNGSAISQDNGKAFDGVSGDALDKSAYDTLAAAIPAQVTNFSLFNRASMDVYTIRVYTGGILTEAEKQLNHFIDLCGYYGVQIPASLSVNALTAIGAAHSNDVFATENDSAVGTADYDTVKASLQADLAEFARFSDVADTNYASYYAGAANGLALAEGVKLVGLFTAFRNDQTALFADIAAGKWTNKVEGGTDATLVDSHDAAAWAVASPNGGLSMGLNGPKYQNATKDNTGIVFNTAWAESANFTVEQLSVITGSHTGSTDVLGHEDDTFKVDLLRGVHFANLDAATETYNGGLNMKLLWRANTSVGWWQEADSRDATMQNRFVANGAQAIGRTMSFIKTTGEDGAVTYGVRYADADGTMPKIVGATYTAEAYVGAASGRAFRLFARAAMDAYAVRVYDGLLTEDQMKYNHLIDLLAFYQVELSANVTAAQLVSFAAKYATTDFVYDDNGKDNDYSVVRAQLTADMEMLGALSTPATLTAYDKLYAAQDNLVGLFTAFSADDDSVRIDYSLWKNKVEGADATLYDNTSAASWGAGLKGGLSLNITTKEIHDSIGANGASIRLDEAWADLASFTVETSSLARGVYSDPAGGLAIGSMQNGDEFEETFCLDMISSAHYFNLYKNSGLPMGFITRMEGVSTADWWTLEGRSVAYQDLINTVNGKALDNAADLGAVPAGLTLTYTKKTDDKNVTFGMNFSNDANANIDAGTKVTGSYSYTLEKYQEVKNAAVITTGHKFSMYNRGMYDVYAIRVYDKVLSADERNWNHLIDLLAFYEIEIPETADNTVLAAMAYTYRNKPFVASEDAADGYKYSQIKAELQNTISRAVTLVVDGNETVYAAVSGTYTLPATLDGYTLFGWTDGAASVAPGTTVTVNGAVTYTALAVDAVTVDANAEATVIQDANENNYAAIRFNARVNKAQFQAMNAISGEGTMNLLEMGILIVPKAYVDGAGAFTKEALDAWYIEARTSEIDREYATGAYLDLISKEEESNDPAFRGGYEDGDTAFILSGGFADFSQATIDNDPDFVAITYFEVDYDKDGKTDNVIYGEYDENNVVSVYDTLNAKLGICEEGSTEYEAIKAIVDNMAARKQSQDDSNEGEIIDMI